MIAPHLRSLTIAAALAAVSSPALAQCFDSYGTPLGTGDDSLFTIQPIGFAFPFAGSTYTDVHISTNGFVYLSNGGTPAPGTASGYSSSAATLSTNLRGGTQAKIAAFWDDLNNLASNSGSVNIDNTLANRCTITWDNTVEFSQTAQKDIQLVLWSDGRIDFVYSLGCLVQTGAALVGCSPGGAADPGQVDVSALPSTTVPTVYQVFTPSSPAFDLGGSGYRFTPNAAGGFDVSALCLAASHTSVGTGCGAAFASFYEAFTSTSANDLAGTTLTATENGTGGYDVAVAPLSTFVAPSSVGLGLDDDQMSGPQALGFSFDYPGGTTTAVDIDSNGRVLLSGSDGSDFSPTVGEMLGEAVHTIAVVAGDLRPDAATNVNNVFFETNGTDTALITWLNVPHFTASNGTATVQLALLHTAAPGGDSFEIRVQTAPGSTALVGFSRGNGALDPGSRDLTAGSFSVASVDTPALRLSASPTPVLGNVVVFTTDNIPASAPIAANVLGVRQLAGGVPLPNAPGCFVYIDNSAPTATFLLTNRPSDTNTLAIPTSTVFLGARYVSQSAAFAPVNAASLITSNAVAGSVSSY